MRSQAIPTASAAVLLLALGQSAFGWPATSSQHRVEKRQDGGGGGGFIETLSEDEISLVKARLSESAHGSWENGTRAQVLLEYDYPMLGVFYNPAIPIAQGHVPAETNTIAAMTMRQRPADIMMFCEDGSAADPASLGISILLANATVSDVDYMTAVDQQNTFLFELAPRTTDGAISHRVDEIQLWSDFMAMVPPYLAYYGALMGNDTFTQAAYDQCRVYRQRLMADNGLWRHIQLGSNIAQDPGFWATGNAWAAWGMLRVLATFMHSTEYSDKLEEQKKDLKDWIVQTITASYAAMDPETDLLPNYLQEDTFNDAAATALMASVSYRLAQLDLDTSTLEQAGKARHAVLGRLNRTTGWLTSVVNPLDWSSEGEESAEGQSFVLSMAASYRDYNLATNQSPPPNGDGSGTRQPKPKPESAASRSSATSAAIALLITLLTVVATGLL